MCERCRDDGIVGQYPAAHREAAADERLPEQGRADMVKRQDAGERARRVARGDKVATVPGRPGDCLAPGAAVEGRRLRVRSDEGRVGKECVGTCRYGWSRYH